MNPIGTKITLSGVTYTCTENGWVGRLPGGDNDEAGGKSSGCQGGGKTNPIGTKVTINGVTFTCTDEGFVSTLH